MYSKDLNQTIVINENNYKSDKIEENKKLILKYLNMFEPYAVSGGLIVDEITGKEVEDIPLTIFTDGVYFWNASYIYHFEKYNMPLKQDFINYVLSSITH